MATKQAEPAAHENTLVVQLVPIGDITPYKNNPRSNDNAVDAVAESLRRFGFRQPIVVDKQHVIVVGHTRWKAAQKLGMEQVPVHVADLTPAEARAYRIADNKTGELAIWDTPQLVTELFGIADMPDWPEMTIPGFDEGELAGLMRVVEESADVPPGNESEKRASSCQTCAARMLIPPRAWLCSGTKIREAFETLGHEWGVEMQWPK